ncbi:MAG: hypothetical protein ABJA66_16080 [Actinomycetota bacterium]
MKSLQTIKFTIFSFVLILIAGAKILAAGGDLDTTFSAGATGFGSYVQTVAVQTGGRNLCCFGSPRKNSIQSVFAGHQRQRRRT